METITDSKSNTVSLTVNPDDRTSYIIKPPDPVGLLRFEELQTVLAVYKELSWIQKWAFRFFFNAKYTKV